MVLCCHRQSVISQLGQSCRFDGRGEHSAELAFPFAFPPESFYGAATRVRRGRIPLQRERPSSAFPPDSGRRQTEKLTAV